MSGRRPWRSCRRTGVRRSRINSIITKALSASEKRDLRSRYQEFNQLSPEKQSEPGPARVEIGNSVSYRRAGKLRFAAEFENLRSMPEAGAERPPQQRRQFRTKYNDNEQAILRNFSGLLSPSK